MSTVAVLAHAGKTFGGGLVELRQRAREAGRRGSALVRGAEEPQGSEAGQARARRGRRPALRLGRGRDGAALHRLALRIRCHDRDRSGGNGQPLRLQPRDPAGHRGGGAHRARRHAAHPRRRAHERRALRGDGGRRLRRADDQGRRRRAEGSLRSPGVRLDGNEAARPEAVRGEDQGRRRDLVRRPGEQRPHRQRRQALRGRRGIRGRAPGRRKARARSRDRGRSPRVDAHDRAHRDRLVERVALRPGDEGDLGAGEVRPQDPVRARRRRPQGGQEAERRDRACGDHGLRSAAAKADEE